MDERSFDEFESVFEAAVRPSVAIEPVQWHRILVAPDGTRRAETALQLALHLARRFGVPLHVVAAKNLEGTESEDERAEQQVVAGWLEQALQQAAAAGVEATGVTGLGNPGEVILQEAEAQPTSLLVLSVPHAVKDIRDKRTVGTTVDHLLTGCGFPMLLLKEPLEQPEAVCRRLLVYIPGGFEVGPHFSVPFAMVEAEGELDLLHVVNADEVRRVAQALEILPDVETEKADAIAGAVEERMEQLLNEAVDRVREAPYTCRSRVELGQPVQRVAVHLVNHRHSLLVVDSETLANEPIPPEPYALIKEISGVPILVL